MHRRNLIRSALSAVSGIFVASRATAATAAAADDRLKMVYHLNEIEKVSFVLGNIQNHYDGVGGPDHVTIALVVHGPALRAFVASGVAHDVGRRVGQISKMGLELAACGNTMKAQSIGLADLLPGFVEAEKGGVVRIAELQSKGYLYIRP